MLRVLIFRTSTAIWKLTLSISQKSRPRTWAFLAAFHASIALISFWAYQADSVRDSVPTPVRIAETTTPAASRVTATSDKLLAANLDVLGLRSQSRFRGMGVDIEYLRTNLTTESSLQHSIGLVAAQKYANTVLLTCCEIGSEGESERLREMSNLSSNVSRLNSLDFNFEKSAVPSPFSHLDPARNSIAWRVPKLGDRSNIEVVQWGQRAVPLLSSLERVQAMIIGVVSLFLSGLNTLFNWQSRKRAKAEAILKDLQILELRARLDQMERERVRAIEEANRSHLIVIP
jgi:hypothetical protein